MSDSTKPAEPPRRAFHFCGCPYRVAFATPGFLCYRSRTMPIDWSDNILLADLAAEPELAEELSAIFDRLKIPASLPQGAARRGDAKPALDVTVPSVVLNFSSVTYLNSSHIAALLRMRKRLIEAGRSFVLCSLNDELWTMMGLAGLDKVFQFAPDTMTALARVQIAEENGGREA